VPWASWATGRWARLCIFFGGRRKPRRAPRAYSPVNILGRVIGDATRFHAVKDGARITIAREANA